MNEYGDVALGIECALPAHFALDDEPRRRARREKKGGREIAPAAPGRFGSRLPRLTGQGQMHAPWARS